MIVFPVTLSTSVLDDVERAMARFVARSSRGASTLDAYANFVKSAIIRPLIASQRNGRLSNVLQSLHFQRRRSANGTLAWQTLIHTFEIGFRLLAYMHWRQ